MKLSSGTPGATCAGCRCWFAVPWLRSNGRHMSRFSPRVLARPRNAPRARDTHEEHDRCGERRVDAGVDRREDRHEHRGRLDEELERRDLPERVDLRGQAARDAAGAQTHSIAPCSSCLATARQPPTSHSWLLRFPAMAGLSDPVDAPSGLRCSSSHDCLSFSRMDPHTVTECGDCVSV